MSADVLLRNTFRSPRRFPAKGVLPLALAFLAICAQSASITLIPLADTSLIEIAPSNNNGGQAWLLSGKIQNDVYRDRALMKFDLSIIPTNALVVSAAVVLEVTRQPGDGLANAPFGLHRMLRPWGEGDKVAITVPGQGLPASPGEATWRHAFFPTNEWAAPGGASGVDFASSASSFQFIYGVAQSPYRFESTPELVDDVQEWVNKSQFNYGWMLLCDDEVTLFTARRFGSREDTNAPPRLEIEYIVPMHIDLAERVGNEFRLHFPGQAGKAYTVEYITNSAASNNWFVLTNIPTLGADSEVVVSDSITNRLRFYRYRQR